MTAHATEDEHGIVSVYDERGTLRMFMHRSNWDAIRESLGLSPLEPERVVSGGGVVYGIERGDLAR